MDTRDIDYTNNEYPKSKRGFQCLGPCNKPGTTIVHPTTLEYIKHDEDPFCAVNEWTYVNPETGTKEKTIIDKCYKETKQVSTNELEMNIIVPRIDFSCEHFLKIYYNIYSMESMVDWMEKNKHMPYYSKRRILECSWKVYGFENYVLDDRLTIIYVDIIKKRWISYIYNHIKNFIHIEKGKISIDDDRIDNTDGNDNNTRITKINFIIDKFINYKMVSKFLTSYINYYKDSHSDIVSHSLQIRNDYTDFIEKKIKASI